METIRLPFVAPQTAQHDDIISDQYSYSINVLARKNPNGSLYFTQRPSLKYYDVSENGSSAGSGFRGAFYSDTAELIIVNDTEIWQGLYATEVVPATNASALVSGTGKCYIEELNGNVFVINRAGNVGKWFDNTATPFYDMDLAAGNGSGTFTYFPPNNSLNLSGGCVVLDRTMYVLTTTKQIWGSDLNDGTSWTSGTNYVTIERTNDSARLIEKHHDHVVYFGSKSIEFFYDAGNATGSPLSNRDDIFYNVGIISEDTICKENDIIYFLGQSETNVGLYKLENFVLTEVKNEYISQLLEETKTLTMSSFYHHGHMYILINPYSSNPATYDSSLAVNLLYDVDNNYLTSINHAGISVNGGLPMIRKSLNYANTGKYMFSGNGDYFLFSNELRDYTVAATSAYESSTLVIKMPAWDNGNNKWKFINSLEFIGDMPQADVSANIYWRNEDTSSDQAVDGSRTLNFSYYDRKLKRLGRCKRRSFQLNYVISDENESHFSGEAFELEFEEGET